MQGLPGVQAWTLARWYFKFIFQQAILFGLTDTLTDTLADTRLPDW